MQVLSVTEVQAVSGAGKVQDTLSVAYGNFFSHAVTALNRVFDLGYEVEAAQQAGQHFGSSLGKAIEDKFAYLLDRIHNKVIG